MGDVCARPPRVTPKMVLTDVMEEVVEEVDEDEEYLEERGDSEAGPARFDRLKASYKGMWSDEEDIAVATQELSYGEFDVMLEEQKVGLSIEFCFMHVVRKPDIGQCSAFCVESLFVRIHKRRVLRQGRKMRVYLCTPHNAIGGW